MISTVQSICSRKNCIVVGSAPGARIPEKQDGDVIIGVNSAAMFAQESGYPVDIFYSSETLFTRKNRRDKRMRSRLNGLNASRAVIWYANCKVSLSDFGISVDATEYITEREGFRMVMYVCGYPLRVSSGIGAACLALQNEAKSVKMVGFSLNDKRHAALPDSCFKPLRDHITEDTNFLTAIKSTIYGGIFNAI